MVLARLARLALERDIVPVVINLANWSGEDNKFWVAHRQQHAEIAHLLLRRFAAFPISTVELNVLPSSRRLLLLVDGLSEIEARIGYSVIAALDDLPAALPSVSVVVADRLVRRPVDPRRWRIATLLPLEERQVRAVLAQVPGMLPRYETLPAERRKLLESPYFLHRFIEGEGELAASRTAEQERWFTTHAGLTEPELRIAAAAAFRFYHESHSRTFRLADFAHATSPDIVRKLQEAGALVVAADGGVAHFDHQLKHDFLAARHLAESRQWDKDSLDVVTLHANSFDVLGLALGLLQDSADEFVRRVYDWNPYGAAYVVAEDHGQELNRISAPMRLIMQAAMAERRFHVIESTIQQAEDALRVIGTRESRVFLAARTVEDVCLAVLGISFPEADWFEQWKDVFTRATGARPTDEELYTIRQPDSILGWTYANVVKRLDLIPRQQELLRTWAEDGSDEVQWRIVHALGSFPSRSNADFLFVVLDQQGNDRRWIRYGAVRSLLEMAARDDMGRYRVSIMERLAARSRRLLQDRQTLNELARAIFITKEAAPRDWADQVKTVLAALFEASSSPDDRSRWLRLADKVEAMYAA